VVAFTVGPRQDFQVTAAPGTGTVPQGSTTAFAVAVTSQQTSFTQLAKLSVSGAPAGVSAVFNPAQITAGASSSLIVDLGASNLQTGSYSFLVHATATIDGVQQDRTASVVLNVTAAGQTTLAGQVVSTSNQPIVGATVSLDGQSVLTDGAGRFLLSGIQSGTNRSLSIDGHSASSPNATFPLIFEPVNVLAGRANVVSNAFHLPPIDTSQEVTINPNADTVAGNASVANLQMTIPVGAHLRMLDGTLVTRTSITPLAPDRTPAPLPSDVGTNIVYTSQPGGAITDIPIPVVYPNLAGLNPGTEVELYAFDHAHVNWFVYGMGKVSTDGRTIAPEINPATGKPYGLPDFSWHFPNTGPNGNPSDPRPKNECNNAQGSNPVDYASGMKIERVPQVSWIGARGGIEFSLIYTTDKAATCISGNACPFGEGWTSDWDIRLTGSLAPGGAGRLVMPDTATGRLYSSSGTDSSGAARFTSTATTSGLGGSLVLGGANNVNQYRDSNGTVLNFNSSGRLVSKVDRNGNTTTLTYSNGNLTQITDPVGRSLTFTYNGNNQVTSMTDPLGRTWHYSQGGTLGQLLSITDPAGNVTTFTYTGARIASVVDPRGNTVKKITYDSNGRVTTETFADGGTETYTYQLSGTIVTGTTVTDPLGRRTSFRFDGNGYIIGTTDAAGQTATITRDLTTSLPLAIAGPCGCQESTRTFDANGNETSISDRLGNTESWIYDPVFNRATQYTDWLGNRSTYSYDMHGNRVSHVDALQQTTSYAYDTFGQLVSQTDPMGHTKHMEHDAFGSLSAVVDELGNRTTFSHDTLGRLVGVTDPLGRAVTYQYDLTSRVTAVSDATGLTTHYAYDANGNRASVTDASGQHWSMLYDARNSLVSRTDPLGQTTLFRYDVGRQMIAVGSPGGRTVQFTYDPRGKTATITDPSGGVTTNTYDSYGNLVTVKDTKGNLTTYSYDALQRRTSRRDAVGSASTLIYDANSRIVQRTDRLGRTTNLSYDALNRVVTKSFPDSVVTYTYNPDGKITGLNDSEGSSISWTYDDTNKVTSEAQAAGVINYTYDTAGEVATMTVAGGSAISYGNDNAGRLSTITQGSDVFTYSYDGLSRLSSLQRPNGVTTAYSYDNAGRLTQLAHGTNGSIENLGYAFTPDNQLSAVSSTSSSPLLPASTTLASADPANRISQSGSDSFTFDAGGEMTSDTNSQGATQYSFDARGRLLQAALPNGQNVTYQYDALGRRISRTTGGITTQYLYDGQDVVREINSDGSTVDYLNGPSIDQKLRQQSSVTGAAYFLQDHLGSTIALTNSSGLILERIQYDPFGGSSGSALTHYLYAGREFDSATGLLYFRARYYSPQLGRFISEDPLGFNGGDTNVYAYVGDDPLSLSDPLGLQSAGTTTAGATTTTTGWTAADEAAYQAYVQELEAEAAAGTATAAVAASEGTAALGAGFGAEVETGAAGGPVGVLVALDAGLAVYDYQQFRNLCDAYGWGWCNHSPQPQAAKKPKKIDPNKIDPDDPDTGLDDDPEPQKAPNNQTENEKFWKVAIPTIQEKCGCELHLDKIRYLHDLISKHGYTIDEIIQIGLSLFCPDKALNLEPLQNFKKPVESLANSFRRTIVIPVYASLLNA
jgi:RHS repeat-associated protein